LGVDTLGAKLSRNLTSTLVCCIWGWWGSEGRDNTEQNSRQIW